MTFSVMTFSIMTFSITKFSSDTQHNDNKLHDNKRNNRFNLRLSMMILCIMQSIVMLIFTYAECHI